MPLPASLRRDDIAVDACSNLISTCIQPPMSFQRGYVGERESMGGGTKKEKPYYDGLRKHRFHALPLPSAGMTCFLRPVPACTGMT